MNANEGLNRIATAIRWIGAGLGLISVGFGVWFFFAAYSDQGIGLVIAVGVGSLLAGAGWVLGWIIDGFAKPRVPGDARDYESHQRR